jgi:hypothetical protein
LPLSDLRFAKRKGRIGLHDAASPTRNASYRHSLKPSNERRGSKLHDDNELEAEIEDLDIDMEGWDKPTQRSTRRQNARRHQEEIKREDSGTPTEAQRKVRERAPSSSVAPVRRPPTSTRAKGNQHIFYFSSHETTRRPNASSSSTPRTHRPSHANTSTPHLSKVRDSSTDPTYAQLSLSDIRQSAWFNALARRLDSVEEVVRRRVQDPDDKFSWNRDVPVRSTEDTYARRERAWRRGTR